MIITYLLSSPYEYKNGCWLYRTQMPAQVLKERGHTVKMLIHSSEIKEEWYDDPDVVIYRGIYQLDPITSIRKFQKHGKKVIYDTDDDILTVNPDNPYLEGAKKKREQYIALLTEADVVITTNEVLKKRILKYNKKVVVIPNALDFTKVHERKGENKILRIGYTGASSHWGDLNLILDVIKDLQKKYKFEFVLQGLCGTPLISTILEYDYILKQGIEPEQDKYYEEALKVYEKLKPIDYQHTPFYMPILYLEILRSLNLDIGICPLQDNAFNRAKTSVKFYEYSAVNTVCLASDVVPYNEECNYCAKNTYKDWYKKLEKLIVNKKFRDKLLKSQWDYVEKKRNLQDVAKKWEKVVLQKK